VGETDPPSVGNKAESNAGKMLGGITGKGFMPGVSGNPSGRPKKRVTESYEGIYDQDAPEKLLEALRVDGFTGKTFGEALAFQHFIGAAKSGDTAAVKEITDRLEGKAEASLKISGSLDLGVAIRAAHEDARNGK
jgi:hypothetical protein